MYPLHRIISILFLIMVIMSLAGCQGAPVTTTPGTEDIRRYNPEKVGFSKKHGFYTKRFYVELSFPVPGATIVYTIDASSPSAAHGMKYTKPILIDKTTVLRAMAYKDTIDPSCISTRTYLFIEDIMHQSVPDTIKVPKYSSVNSQIIDYKMDPDIINHEEYSRFIEDSLLSIPTISLVTDYEHFFDKRTGIYTNPFGKGEAWERPVSVELITPYDDSEEHNFQVNGGVRIRGAYSRSKDNPKHSFRLFFKSAYGESKLQFPLFGKEGVSVFDKIDLRTSQNYAWAKEGSSKNTMVREIFSRDVMREMGQPYTRSRYIHVYLNGLYWGVYQTQERADVFFAQSYFGGKRKDYDVVKVDCGPMVGDFEIERADGDLENYWELFKIMKRGFKKDGDYFFSLGRNPDGTINPDYKVMIDEENLIDYMLVVFYTGNFDAPITRFRGDREPNNFYAIYDKNGWYGWKFIMHDSEHSMFELRDNRTGPFTISSNFTYFNPGYVHQKLCVHPEYRMKFIDRVYRHFYGKGVFVPERALQIMQNRIDEVRMAMIAESARWGDSKRGHPLTIKDWQKEIDYLLDVYIPQRRDIVLQQLKEKKLYPSIEPPQFFIRNREMNGLQHEIDKNSMIRITNPNADGTIFYTLDGRDPRDFGGIPAATAQSQARGSTDITIKLITTQVVKARVKYKEEWSALQETVFFIKDEDFSGVCISEIHYHPQDTKDIDGDEYEFIEVCNPGDTPVNLTACQFIMGVQFTFPSTILAPGEYVVIVKNNRAFMKLYGDDIPVIGTYTGNLRNKGETLTLASPGGKPVITITYDNKGPWPVSAAGKGYSLELKGPGFPVNDGTNWAASQRKRGTPGSSRK